MSEKEVHVTSIEELKKVAMGELVELPPFAEGSEFIARLRKPSMMALAKAGRIPNSLLDSANELFAGNKAKTAKELSKPDNLSKMYDLCKIMAEASLMEPTYKELQNAGIELTDTQLLAIFTYSQTGVKKLESFREGEGNSKPDRDVEAVPEKTV